MTARRDAVEQTREGVLRAAYELWLDRPYEQVTLDAVADRAGVARQTVLRHFGSKDDLAVAVVDWQRPQEESARDAEPGDVSGGVRRLLARYEEMGDANVRLLELEGRVDAVGYLIEQGRQSHRAWIERTFGPHLPARPVKRRAEVVLALYAATDVTVWKLLRRDFGSSPAETERTVRRLVDGVLGALAPTRKDP